MALNLKKFTELSKQIEDDLKNLRKAAGVKDDGVDDGAEETPASGDDESATDFGKGSDKDSKSDAGDDSGDDSKESSKKPDAKAAKKAPPAKADSGRDDASSDSEETDDSEGSDKPSKKLKSFKDKSAEDEPDEASKDDGSDDEGSAVEPKKKGGEAPFGKGEDSGDGVEKSHDDDDSDGEDSYDTEDGDNDKPENDDESDDSEEGDDDKDESDDDTDSDKDGSEDDEDDDEESDDEESDEDGDDDEDELDPDEESDEDDKEIEGEEVDTSPILGDKTMTGEEKDDVMVNPDQDAVIRAMDKAEERGKEEVKASASGKAKITLDPDDEDGVEIDGEDEEDDDENSEDESDEDKSDNPDGSNDKDRDGQDHEDDEEKVDGEDTSENDDDESGDTEKSKMVRNDDTPPEKGDDDDSEPDTDDDGDGVPSGTEKDKGLSGKNVEKSKPKKKIKEHVVVAFGRMNPPTLGHARVVEKVKALAEELDGEARVYLSHSYDKTNNPLTYEEKLNYARIAFGDVIFESDVNDFFKLIKSLEEDFYKVTVVVGSDRLAEMTKLQRYNGVHYDFESIEIVSAGQRDADDAVSQLSATKLREAARKKNFKMVMEGLPVPLKPLTEEIATKLYPKYRSLEDTIRDLAR